ncbi:MAG: hypothetical protein IH988_08565 [Planctomycetes bacterium]|nr:hypothetical protein [Planctomycetota bacterium]
MIRSFLQIVLWSAVLAGPVGANDWPNWRGPEQTGMSRERAPITSWSESGDNLLWRVPVGGRTTPVVMAGRLYAITPTGEGECLREQVICLDADTGKPIPRCSVRLTGHQSTGYDLAWSLGDWADPPVVTTGPDGVFRIEIRTPVSEGDGYRSRYHIDATHLSRRVLMIDYRRSAWTGYVDDFQPLVAMGEVGIRA